MRRNKSDSQEIALATLVLLAVAAILALQYLVTHHFPPAAVG
jgi:hypothetical protein